MVKKVSLSDVVMKSTRQLLLVVLHVVQLISNVLGHCSSEGHDMVYTPSTPHPLVNYHYVNEITGEDELFVVASGQRVADAVHDFALLHNIISDNDNDTLRALDEIYWDICGQLQQDNIINNNIPLHVCECDSPVPSRLVVKLNTITGYTMASDVTGRDWLSVRAGYTPRAIAHFHCIDTNCSYEEYQRLTVAVEAELKNDAFKTWKYTPFALLDGFYLKQLLQYMLLEMKLNSHVMELCSIYSVCNQTQILPNMQNDICEQSYVTALLYTCRELQTGDVFDELHIAILENNMTWIPGAGNESKLFRYCRFHWNVSCRIIAANG